MPCEKTLARSGVKLFPFMELPYEIREIIWKLCIPARIFEVGSPDEWGEPGVKCLIRRTSYLNWKIPTLGHICRESRSVCLKIGQWEPGRCWFTPTHDVAFMHWIPEYSSIIWGGEVDCNPDHFQYQGRCQGLGIVAKRLQDFWPVPPRIKAQWINDDLQVLARTETDWLVSMRIIVIHTTVDAGRRSGLFGLLGDAPIQLVEVTDTETIARYRDLWAASEHRTPEPNEFFGDLQGFWNRVQEWVAEVETIWVFNEWFNISYPNPREDIWLGPQVKPNGEPINRLRWEDLTTVDDETWQVNLDMERFSMNRKHPFVQKSLASMPRFHPRIMFRLCPDICPTDPTFHTTMGTWAEDSSDSE